MHILQLRITMQIKNIYKKNVSAECVHTAVDTPRMAIAKKAMAA